MKLFVIILHFGDIKTTSQCIDTLRRNDTYPKTIVVVNNTSEKIKKYLSQKTVIINNKKNLGFAGGVNVGIQYSLKKKADMVCLLNNDTIITKPFLEELVKEFSNKKVGVVGPAIEFWKRNKKLYDVGGSVHPLFLRTSHTEVDRITNKDPQNVGYVSGCCMLIKKEVFKKVGLFDESFFLYYEDADFCLRAKEKGFIVRIVPSVVIHHILSATVGKMSQLAMYHLLRSGIFFGKKHAKTFLQRIAHRIFILFQAGLFLRANPQAGLVIAKAMIE